MASLRSAAAHHRAAGPLNGEFKSGARNANERTFQICAKIPAAAIVRT